MALKLSNLKQAAALGETLTWTVPNWSGPSAPPTITVEPMVQANKNFLQARLAWETGKGAKTVARRGMSSAKFDELREADYVVLPKLVRGWSGLFEDDGKPVEFPPPVPASVTDKHERALAEAKRIDFIEEVLRALGDYNFDELRMYARSPESAAQPEAQISGN